MITRIIKISKDYRHKLILQFKLREKENGRDWRALSLIPHFRGLSITYNFATKQNEGPKGLYTDRRNTIMGLSTILKERTNKNLWLEEDWSFFHLITEYFDFAYNDFKGMTKKQLDHIEIDKTRYPENFTNSESHDNNYCSLRKAGLLKQKSKTDSFIFEFGKSWLIEKLPPEIEDYFVNLIKENNRKEENNYYKLDERNNWIENDNYEFNELEAVA